MPKRRDLCEMISRRLVIIDALCVMIGFQVILVLPASTAWLVLPV